jgi:hypothetical protein
MESSTKSEGNGAVARSARSRLWQPLLLAALLPIPPAIGIACHAGTLDSEPVGSSVNAQVTDAESWDASSSTMTQALNTHTAAGHYTNGNGRTVPHQITTFNGDFTSGGSAAYVTRDDGNAMGAITPITTTNWGMLELGDGSHAASYTFPDATAYVNVLGTWIAAAQAVSTNGGFDLALAVTTNGGSTWPNVYSYMSFTNPGYGGTLLKGAIGDIEIAVDPVARNWPDSYTNPLGQTSLAGPYNTIYVYFTGVSA